MSRPFLLRNMRWTMTADVRDLASTRRAMKAYRVAHPVCEWDGVTTPVEVHHVVPVHVRPDLAAEPGNMISLGARRTHLTVGHANNFTKRWVANVREVCALRRVCS